MKKTFLWLAGAAMLLASCSESDGFLTTSTSQNASRETVAFGVYTNNTQVTRAGYPGEIDLATLKATGFGVYGYVAENYAATGLKPDFMWNQQVAFDGTNWTYSPVKYWPNQADVTDGGVDDLQDGTAINKGEKIDRVSFFAYAPFVSESEITYSNISDAKANADEKTGITYVTKSDETGDPKVVYAVSNDPANGVDLMYGVSARDYTGADEFIGKDATDVTAGLPFIDMTKQTVDGKLEYKFRHALTKLLVDVDGYFDEDRLHGTTHDNDIDINTRVMIESVTITSDGLSTGGVLNLNNTTANEPLWEDAADNKLSGEYSLPIANNLKHRPATDGVDYFGSQLMGVTKTAQPLFNTAGTGMMFVPTEGTTNDMTVKIVYYVITRDSRLEKGYSVVKNTISNTVSGFAFEAGKANILHLHIGLTTVKFEADVVAWDTTTGTEVDTDLPLNIQPVASTSKVESTFRIVDMGAAGNWANMNVGATKNTEYGGYYTYPEGDGTNFTKVNGEGDATFALTKVVTKDQMDALCNTTNFTWTWYAAGNEDYEGAVGYEVKCNANGNTIFLPAAGYYDGGSVNDAGSYGNYWSSAPNGTDDAYGLYFYSGTQNVGSNYRTYGQSLRAVSE